LLLGRLGENLAIIPGTSITFWPPAGLFLGVLLVTQPRQWAWFVLAGMAAELACNALWFHHAYGPAASYFVANAAEALTAAYLVRLLSGPNFRIERLRDVYVFLLAACVAPVVGATGIALIDHVTGNHPFTMAWPLVWLGDASGLLVSTPLTLFAINSWRERARLGLPQLAEALSLCVLLIAVGAAAFRSYLPTPFLAMPLLLWASVRFRLAGAAVAIAGQMLLIGAMAVVDRDRILAEPELAHGRVVMMQVFLAVSSVSCIIVAALASQYKEALESLKNANTDLEVTVRDRTADLARSEARLRLFIESAPVAIAMFDRERRYLEASEKWKELFGLVGDLAGTPHDQTPFGLSTTWAAAEASVWTGETVSAPRDPLCINDTAEKWVKWEQQPWWMPDGSVAGVLVSVEDISSHVLVEQTLREADRRKDEFLAVLAHELRNPLAPIRTGLDVLKADSSPDLREEVVEMMDRQMVHLVALVDDLLDVSRLTRGKIQLRWETVDLRDTVRGAVEATRGLIHDRRHHLSVDLPDRPVPVRGDHVRLSQVVVNLLSNAAKYTETGGQIGVALRIHGGVAQLEVVDTGIGLEPHEIDRIWDMFGQTSQSNQAGGLGIGLALIRSLVSMHQGRAWAQSDGKGRGSTFSVEFPVIDAVPETPRVELRPSSFGGTRVLLVEDNLDVQEAMRRLLTLTGAEVLAVSDGPSALAVARDFGPHAVLCDLGMPGMDGLEVARRLRDIPEFRDTLLLVALTGYGSEDDRAATLAAGFDRHLTKPVSRETLAQALQTDRATARLV
jgi:integral membrane sensor domain MASE1/CheY-like chemotaxis protein